MCPRDSGVWILYNRARSLGTVSLFLDLRVRGRLWRQCRERWRPVFVAFAAGGSASHPPLVGYGGWGSGG